MKGQGLRADFYRPAARFESLFVSRLCNLVNFKGRWIEQPLFHGI